MNLAIRLLKETELKLADHIFRLAFGTFIGLPKPTDFAGDADYIKHRWYTNPQSAFAAEVDGKLIGSNLVTQWGSFASFGPLSVHPDFWNQGIAKRLIEPAISCFDEWNTQLAGIHTFANSSKHHLLYQKFGFHLRFLTTILNKSVKKASLLPENSRYSQMTENERYESLKASMQLTDSIFPGLDVSQQIQTVESQNLGDTIFLWEDAGLAGFAVCHIGAGTEAGDNNCFVKFGAVRSDTHAQKHFDQLLDLCEVLTVTMGMSSLVAGVNTSRETAYLQMLSRGFRSQTIGVAMHRPNQPGYNCSDVFVIDDWR
ncbi:GNAT family N-acetyltransferase [Sphaerospermopsis torques-reginae]|uniref:GNAT family N-acetyltransferase n=1 Tax=Sphaerospermopsis torques-reginae ITEP-024 TaxID=984208 RepID=A0ABX8WZ41_9CYAN|nr:GNAT family N-acetyltransferase [Sphaerospermopsis torques-reginae]QYX31742.1 GNAT family N-acetyltransferase [Sphaerospermopsis torques-reginae ITEP-024]